MQPRGDGPLLIAVTVTQSFIGLVFVCIRTFARIRIMQGLRYDDYLLWAAMVLLLAYTGNTIAAVYHGLGYPAADMNWETFLKLMPYFFAYPALLTFSLLFSKAAVAAFLAILVIKRTHKAILWGSLGVLCLLSVLEFIGLFVQCFPVQANWDLTLDKNCHFNSTTVGYLLTGYGAFLDFFFAALPWIFFSKLRMDRKDKLTVCIALSAGVFAGICGIIRLVELYKFQKTRPDGISTLCIWTSTENCVSVVCVCLASTRSLYRHYIKGPETRPNFTSNRTGHRLSSYGSSMQDRLQNRGATGTTGTETSVWSDGDVLRSDNNKTTPTGTENTSGSRREELGSIGNEFHGRLSIKKTTDFMLDHRREPGPEGEAGRENVGKRWSGDTV